MRPRRERWAVAVVILATLCGACSRGTQNASSASITHLTALGDSVPYGTACDCTPYPALTARDITEATSHDVETSNQAVAGDKSADVLADVEKQQRVIGDVQSSQVVTLEVGANDVGFSEKCGTQVSCYESALPALRANLDAIVRRVHELTSAHSVAVVMLDYWSVWLGGQYSQAQGAAYVDAAETVTREVNDTIREIAASTRSLYVDLRTAFKGPDDAWDETHLLAPDGDHPNAAGHERIAQAIRDTVAARA